MKIMYYELIRMLIDYERKNHPSTYDATKTVGKIEGYQELTNKLQRFVFKFCFMVFYWVKCQTISIQNLM